MTLSLTDSDDRLLQDAELLAALKTAYVMPCETLTALIALAKRQRTEMERLKEIEFKYQELCK